MHSILKSIMALLLILAMLMICGCTASDNSSEAEESTAVITEDSVTDDTTPALETLDPMGESDPDSPEIEFAYIKYMYNLMEGTFFDEEYNVKRSLTGFAGAPGNPAYGTSLITDYWRYSQLITLLEKYQTGEGPAELFEFEKCYSSPDLVIDEAFFQKYDLFVVDWMNAWALHLNTELSVVENEVPELTLRLRLGVDYGTTADNCGVLYLIALPKEYYYPHIIWR